MSQFASFIEFTQVRKNIHALLISNKAQSFLSFVYEITNQKSASDQSFHFTHKVFLSALGSLQGNLNVQTMGMKSDYYYVTKKGKVYKGEEDSDSSYASPWSGFSINERIQAFFCRNKMIAKRMTLKRVDNTFSHKEIFSFSWDFHQSIQKRLSKRVFIFRNFKNPEMPALLDFKKKGKRLYFPNYST